VSDVASGRPGAVLDRVDAELRALWSAQSAPGETPRARACTMNLVVVAPTAGLAERWLPVVDEVLLGIPARAIVVGLDPGGADGLEAGTTAVCVPGQAGGPLVCSERVTLVARGAVCARLPSFVASVCATDVPTTLVWLGKAEAGDPAFEPLARDASRIVLDATEGSLASLVNVVYWARTRSTADRPGVADLVWTRLAPWQEMCARMFDEPRLRSLAASVTRVSLVQASAPGEPLGPEGSLLLGWLATRLGWKAKPGDPRKELGLERADGAGVEVGLGSDAAPQVARRALLAVRIEASAGDLRMHGEIARDRTERDAATWRLEVTHAAEEPRRIEQHVRLRATETAGVLERTLHRPSHDGALSDAAAWVDELGEGELACGGVR
jgi:hypothetical protein